MIGIGREPARHGDGQRHDARDRAGRIKPPGSDRAINLPIYWGVDQFALAAAFAIPVGGDRHLAAGAQGRARASVDILRGGVNARPNVRPAVLLAEHLTRRLEGEVPVTLVEDADVRIERGEFVVIRPAFRLPASRRCSTCSACSTARAQAGCCSTADTPAASTGTDSPTRLAKLGFVFQFHFLLNEFSAPTT